MIILCPLAKHYAKTFQEQLKQRWYQWFFTYFQYLWIQTAKKEI